MSLDIKLRYNNSLDYNYYVRFIYEEICFRSYVKHRIMYLRSS